MAEFLHEAAPPVAMVAYDDMAAVAALRAAHQAGWRVPEDLSVVGIDDIQFASYTNPGLTTVAQPKQELGALAVDAALARAGKQTATPASDGRASDGRASDGGAGDSGGAGDGGAGDGGGGSRVAATAKAPARTLDGHLVVRESTAPAVPRQPVPDDGILRGGSDKELAR